MKKLFVSSIDLIITLCIGIIILFVPIIAISIIFKEAIFLLFDKDLNLKGVIFLLISLKAYKQINVK